MLNFLAMHQPVYRVATSPQAEAQFAIVDYFAENPGTLVISLVLFLAVSVGLLYFSNKR